MRAKAIDCKAARTWALIFDTGDEVLSSLQAFATQQQLTAARFTAIGAFRDVILGYFDWQSKTYEKIPMREQVECFRSSATLHWKAIRPGSTRTSCSASATAARMAGTCSRPTCDRRSR
jgi:hypothetical protein